jgi:eukaryotic-like serine/threonine-protein kinase
MQLPATTFALGEIIHERYVVEDVLGVGGSSNVYLVRDLQRAATAEQEMRFALKELRGTDKHERIRFAFEAAVLKRLTHPSLPRIYDLYEESPQSPGFLILEYIPGVSLEILRKRQPEQRFNLAEVIILLKPIVNATIYLHHQNPPVVHRDIKPANIIVVEESQRTFLIDFGIAKEYEVDATTTAVRQCTPGYGAPEQYANIGTDPRADVYSLGATCYCLLTGTIPVDALQRTASIVTKEADAIRPINQLVTDLPPHVVQAIERAMAIGYEQRFLNVEDFWAALNGASIPLPEPSSPLVLHDTDILPRTATIVRKPSQSPKTRMMIVVLVAALMLSLLGGGIAWAMIYTPLSTSQVATKKVVALSTKKLLPTATATSAILYPHIAEEYSGTQENLLTQAKDTITLTDVEQNQQSLSGRFTGMKMTTNFTGVLDASNHILLTVPRSGQNSPLFFDGTVRADGILVGNYCNQDQAGQCVSNYGLWSLAPGK